MAQTHRSVTLERLATGTYVARNARGGEIRVSTGDDADFTPVELFLAALAGCSAVDVDAATARHAEPTAFTVRAEGEKQVTGDGPLLRDLAVTFAVTFPEGDGGEKARTILPRAVRTSHDRTCTVSRTVEAGGPVTIQVSEG